MSTRRNLWRKAFYSKTPFRTFTGTYMFYLRVFVFNRVYDEKGRIRYLVQTTWKGPGPSETNNELWSYYKLSKYLRNRQPMTDQEIMTVFGGKQDGLPL